MEWVAEGLVLASRPHGENAAIVDLFTAEQGRHAGVVRGGTGRRLAPLLIPGNRVRARWQARLAGHLGHFTIEPVAATGAALLGGRLTLAALMAVAALIQRSLPERDPHPLLYGITLALVERLVGDPDWPVHYLRWEGALLAELGYGLDLSSCAVTGAREGLAWVSPRSGRAVSDAGAQGWQDRLLPLPRCLLDPGNAGPLAPEDLAAGLRLTGHFLRKGLLAEPDARPLPAARARLASLLIAAADGPGPPG